MRKIDDEHINAIKEKAKELMDLVDKADCRLICHMDGGDWGVGIKVVPYEVEMGEHGIVNDDGEAEPIDTDELQSTGLYATVLDPECNSLFEEDECQEPYRF